MAKDGEEAGEVSEDDGEDEDASGDGDLGGLDGLTGDFEPGFVAAFFDTNEFQGDEAANADQISGDTGPADPFVVDE